MVYKTPCGQVGEVSGSNTGPGRGGGGLTVAVSLAEKLRNSEQSADDRSLSDSAAAIFPLSALLLEPEPEMPRRS